VSLKKKQDVNYKSTRVNKYSLATSSTWKALNNFLRASAEPGIFLKKNVGPHHHSVACPWVTD